MRYGVGQERIDPSVLEADLPCERLSFQRLSLDLELPVCHGTKGAWPGNMAAGLISWSNGDREREG
jgi:hypothetical protein